MRELGIGCQGGATWQHLNILAVPGDGDPSGFAPDAYFGAHVTSVIDACGTFNSRAVAGEASETRPAQLRQVSESMRRSALPWKISSRSLSFIDAASMDSDDRFRIVIGCVTSEEDTICSDLALRKTP